MGDILSMTACVNECARRAVESCRVHSSQLFFPCALSFGISLSLFFLFKSFSLCIFSLSFSLFLYVSPILNSPFFSFLPQQADELAPAAAPALASELMEDTAPEDVNAPATNEEVLREAAADAEPWTVRRDGGVGGSVELER